METLDYIRMINIFIAILALTLNLMKGYYLQLHKHMTPDSMMGFLAVLAWCLGFATAGTIAAFNNVQTGIWTIIMVIPTTWTLIAGLMGWDRRTNARPIR